MLSHQGGYGVLTRDKHWLEPQWLWTVGKRPVGCHLCGLSIRSRNNSNMTADNIRAGSKRHVSAPHEPGAAYALSVKPHTCSWSWHYHAYFTDKKTEIWRSPVSPRSGTQRLLPEPRLFPSMMGQRHLSNQRRERRRSKSLASSAV